MENSIDIFPVSVLQYTHRISFFRSDCNEKDCSISSFRSDDSFAWRCFFRSAGRQRRDPGKLVIIDAKDKDGADIKDQVKVVENDESKKAKEDASQKVLSDVLGKDYKASLAVDAAYDLDYAGSSFPLSVTFEYKSAKSGDTLYVLQKTADGWKRLDATVANGKITVAFASADPFVIVRDTASSSSDSPKTGYNSALIATVALISLAGAAYAIKRAVAAHN